MGFLEALTAIVSLIASAVGTGATVSGSVKEGEAQEEQEKYAEKAKKTKEEQEEADALRKRRESLAKAMGIDIKQYHRPGDKMPDAPKGADITGEKLVSGIAGGVGGLASGIGGLTGGKRGDGEETSEKKRKGPELEETPEIDVDIIAPDIPEVTPDPVVFGWDKDKKNEKYDPNAIRRLYDDSYVTI